MGCVSANVGIVVQRRLCRLGRQCRDIIRRQKANISLRMKDMQYYRQGNYPGYTAFPPKVLSQSTQSPARARTVVVQNIRRLCRVIMAPAKRRSELRLSCRFLLRCHRRRPSNGAERNPQFLRPLRQCQHRAWRIVVRNETAEWSILRKLNHHFESKTPVRSKFRRGSHAEMPLLTR